MKTMKKSGWVLVAISFLAFVADTPYEESVRAWQKKRVESLKSEEGWLNLAGLFWLKEGENTLGGSDKNTLVFPSDHSDPFLGKLILKDGKVTFETAKEGSVRIDGKAVTQQEVFPYTKPVVQQHRSLRWFIIQRGDQYAVRLRDLESPELKAFTGIPTFPISEQWRIRAKFVPTESKKLSITDITGRTYDSDSPGELVFTVDGKEQRLAATGTPNHLHFVFSDQTNKHGTYGGGRFLDAEGPDASGFTYLDFNKAYNPPCAFTPYATCPTPPKENRLTVAIKAGEQYHGDH